MPAGLQCLTRRDQKTRQQMKISKSSGPKITPRLAPQQYFHILE